MRSLLPRINKLPDIKIPPLERDTEGINASFFMTSNNLDLCAGCLGIFAKDAFALYGIHSYCHNCAMIKVKSSLLSVLSLEAVCGGYDEPGDDISSYIERCGELQIFRVCGICDGGD